MPKEKLSNTELETEDFHNRVNEALGDEPEKKKGISIKKEPLTEMQKKMREADLKDKKFKDNLRIKTDGKKKTATTKKIKLQTKSGWDAGAVLKNKIY